MNERTKQLADQAWEYARERQDFPDEDNEDSYYRNFQEKFAELIVQECYWWAKENGGIPSDEDHRALKEHFGIK